jgi:hypothetical protein
VIVSVGEKYQVSRIAEDGAIQWTYELSLDPANLQTEVFIEYALNPVFGGDNTLVIACDKFQIAVMKISLTELEATTGPVLSSLKLFKESAYRGVTSAVYVKPSSTLVYMLKKNESTYYIGYFDTTSLTISYKKAFYHCDDLTGYNPRGIFKER